MSSDFTTTFTVPARPIQAFEAAASPKSWWNEMIVGSAAKVGDTFVFDVPKLHHSKFDVIEANPGHTLTWMVVPSGGTSDQEEWIGTVVAFEFEPDPAGTRITFTHRGLRPELECHTVCTTAWGYHLRAGLEALLTGETPAPITPDTYRDVADTVGGQRNREG
ncbi:SRPBCC domain-containing protein [Rhodococcus sp. H36-A4]|uniref:SRPBCC family protein n=1 Tax=Rhodococcus sp. H36-A4 TaxID=3004353 RepID=UPI0022AF66D2|nr:SRPBCC domain-containing protein [Rhodococcus sp. H36-A4]MCZ4076982.1 SRPBCC domain-containing protein [Rhodococcus sp. H36-A4]